MIVLACNGIVRVRRDGLERRFEILHWLFLLVGLGSTLFHLTLRHSMQVLDEVPMIWGSCFMVYTMQGVRKQESSNPQLAIFLSIYCVTFAGLYLSLANPAILSV